MRVIRRLTHTQAGALRGGAEVVVASPGRLKDLIDRGECRLNRVGITVLDEADQMADTGFTPPPIVPPARSSTRSDRIPAPRVLGRL